MVKTRGKLSRLAGLYLGLADVKDAFHRFKISKLYSSFFALPEVESMEEGAPWIGRVCHCFSSLPMGHTWSLFFCQKAIEEAMWATPGLEKAEILHDSRSCVIPRPSDEENDEESLYCASQEILLRESRTLRDFGRAPEPKCKPLSVLCRQL